MIKLKGYLWLMLFCWPLLLTAENLATSEPAALSVGKLTSEMQEGFVAVGRLPRLGWQLNSSDNGSRQTAYEIEIKNSCTGHSVWNSGKIISTQSQLVSVPETGFSVEPTYTYLWRVRVWDETDTPSQWSREAVFHIVPDDLAAGQWIGAITRQEARLPKAEIFMGAN